MSTATLTPQEIIAAVDQMDEDQLDILWDAAKARHKTLRDQKARDAALNIKVGDKVRISNIRPKTLDGATGEVVSKSGGRSLGFNVKLDEEFARYPNDTPGIPASCLTKIES